MLTTEEIEYSISEAYRLHQPTSLRFEQPGKSQIAVDIEGLSGATLLQNQITTRNSRLFIPVERLEPLMVMYFQLKGGSVFSLNDTIQVPERRHSLCYVPTLQINYTIEENASIQDMSIRFKPDVIASQLLEESMWDEDWLRLLETEDQVYANLRESRQISPQMLATLHQLLNCPYKGRLGQAYKDSLIRLLLIEQLSTFRQKRWGATSVDTKLTRRDIETLHDLKSHLEQNYLGDLSLDKIAKEFGLNTFKLKYGFKKLFDTSVMRYIDDQKMGYARQLLLDGNEDVWNISDQLGYNHYTNFSAAFKRRFGYSPVQLKDRSPVLD